MLFSRKSLLFILGLSVFLSASTAHAVEFGIRGTFWYPKLTGHIKLDSQGITGTNISLDNELGFDSHAAPMVEVFAGIGRHQLSAMYTKLDFSETVDLEQSITFNGVTFGAQTELASEVDWNMFDFAYKFTLLDLENILAGFSVGLVAQAKYLDAKTSMHSELDDTEHSFNALVPMVGAAVHVGLLADILEARARVTGIGYDGNSFIEALGELTFTPMPFIGVSAGYRVMALDVEYDGQSVDGNFGGPYGLVSLSW